MAAPYPNDEEQHRPANDAVSKKSKAHAYSPMAPNGPRIRTYMFGLGRIAFARTMEGTVFLLAAPPTKPQSLAILG